MRDFLAQALVLVRRLQRRQNSPSRWNRECDIKRELPDAVRKVTELALQLFDAQAVDKLHKLLLGQAIVHPFGEDVGSLHLLHSLMSRTPIVLQNTYQTCQLFVRVIVCTHEHSAHTLRVAERYRVFAAHLHDQVADIFGKGGDLAFFAKCRKNETLGLLLLPLLDYRTSRNTRVRLSDPLLHRRGSRRGDDSRARVYRLSLCPSFRHIPWS